MEEHFGIFKSVTAYKNKKEPLLALNIRYTTKVFS